jgi:hypothetical protein
MCTLTDMSEAEVPSAGRVASSLPLVPGFPGGFDNNMIKLDLRCIFKRVFREGEVNCLRDHGLPTICEAGWNVRPRQGTERTE